MAINNGCMPFTQSLILVGSNHISQILPGDLTELRSDFQINLGSNSGSDRFDQVANTSESPAADSFARNFGKPAFDLVEPR